MGVWDGDGDGDGDTGPSHAALYATWELSWGRSCSTSRLDGDGDLDVVTGGLDPEFKLQVGSH